LKFAGTCIAYGAPSDVAPTQVWIGLLPSHAGAALATVGAVTRTVATSADTEKSESNLTFFIS
jgi:hypothetical protein